ncbi:MAG: hypothetical protein D6773_16470 [Alphaproteobacteria bacterium]|nr:MAG: hypothetical protein D6773_16470 [Alphaproteobacteria bacterium]
MLMKGILVNCLNPAKFASILATCLLLTAPSLYATTANAAAVKEPIPRAASTPDTPKNWAGPKHKIFAQLLVDELMAAHPEVMSITMHGTPPGTPKGTYTMFAGSFPDRIGNESSPGDIITIEKAVTQVESKWGSPNWKKKVSIVLPLKDRAGNYLPAAMVVAFKTSPDDTRIDTDFMAPGIAMRDSLNARIASFQALFAPVD